MTLRPDQDINVDDARLRRRPDSQAVGRQLDDPRCREGNRGPGDVSQVGPVRAVDSALDRSVAALDEAADLAGGGEDA